MVRMWSENGRGFRSEPSRTPPKELGRKLSTKGCEAVSKVGGKPGKNGDMETKRKKAFKDRAVSNLPIHIKNSSHMRTEKCSLDFSSLEVNDHLSKIRGGGQGILQSE